MKKLNEDISAIHRQVACYRFEQELHEEFRKESFLSKEKISEIFKAYGSIYGQICNTG
jgi:oligoendopeptidase F